MTVLLIAWLSCQEVPFERKLLVTLPEGADDYWRTFESGGRTVVFTEPREGKRAAVIGKHRGEAFDRILAICVSADGRSFAYFAGIDGKWFVIAPQQKFGPYEDVGGLVLASDGHPIYGAAKGGKWRICGWEEQDPFDAVGDPVLDPMKLRLAYFAKREERWDVVVDGRRIEQGFDRVEPELKPPVFSADGERIAYAGMKKDHWEVIVVGRRFSGFDRVDDLQFSSDGRRFGFVAERGKKSFVVVDGEEQESFESVWGLVFSPDGKTVGYGARAGGSSFVVVDGKRGPDFEDVMPAGFGPEGRSFAYFARRGQGEVLVERLERGERFDVWHRVGPEWEQADGAVFSRDGRRIAYWATGQKREFVVVGEERSEEFDQVWTPVFDAEGKRIAFGARKGNELWWEVWTIETKADRVRRRLLELIDLAKAGDFRKAADYVVYRGDDKTREWKDVCDPDNEEERRGVAQLCGRVVAELGKGFEWGSFTTKTESEGEWCVWEVLTGEKRRYYCFLLVKGRYAIGDID